MFEIKLTGQYSNTYISKKLYDIIKEIFSKVLWLGLCYGRIKYIKQIFFNTNYSGF